MRSSQVVSINFRTGRGLQKQDQESASRGTGQEAQKADKGLEGLRKVAMSLDSKREALLREMMTMQSNLALKKQLVLHTSLLVHREVHPTLPTRSCENGDCECCKTLCSARARLVSVVPEKKNRERGHQVNRMVTADRHKEESSERHNHSGPRVEEGGCSHVVLPECCGYEYKLDPGGCRITVTAIIRNPYDKPMLAVSLNVTAVGYYGDCRSVQEEIPARQQRELAGTTLLSMNNGLAGERGVGGCSLENMVVNCIVFWAHEQRPNASERLKPQAVDGKRVENAHPVLTFTISAEQRLVTPVPGPHTLQTYPLQLTVTAWVTLHTAGNGSGGVRGVTECNGHGLVNMLAGLFAASPSTKPPPPGAIMLYVPGGCGGVGDGVARGDGDSAVRVGPGDNAGTAAGTSSWVSFAVFEEGERQTVLQLFCMEEGVLALAIKTIQAHLPEYVSMSWRKLPLHVEHGLLAHAAEAMAKEMEFGLEVVAKVESDGSLAALTTQAQLEWLQRQCNTDSAVAELAQAVCL